MLRRNERNLDNIPAGTLGIIAIDGCQAMGKEVDHFITTWRHEDGHKFMDDVVFSGYQRDSYLVNAHVPRFGSGEAKGVIDESVRGMDLYILVDVCNYSLTYSMSGNTNHMSPDDHYQNLKRIIAAVGGKAKRINVIMPFLYESRQHKRSSRESLDCALALQELTHMGVDNIITFDAHDPRVQNAIPLSGFETVRPTYQFVKGLLDRYDDLIIDSDHMMAISPDEGAFLLSFCNNMSPMFILGVLFRNYIPEHALHLPFFLILTGSPLLCSQMFRLYYTHKPRIHSEEYRTCAIGSSVQPASHSFGTILNTSITESADAIIRVALYMMLASIWMHMLDQIILTDSVGKTILLSAFEITTGLELLSGLAISRNIRYLIMLALTSFGGISSILQTMSMVQRSGLKMIPYIAEKLVTMTVTSLLAYLYLIIINY